ncbi:pheromone-regulated membrane protein [Mucor ambiguus]|uniref:Pheromone-regulated membrane protein n=1 Tax=Mucor ambiguus TaxID=91626 RepID=A0A0C9LZZ6_9FUNG|nr:pheromone-regulated membrane protein [Mucor ambiguus]
MPISHKKTLSSSYYDAGSFSSIASQATLTELPARSNSNQTINRLARQQTSDSVAVPAAVAAIGPAMDAPLPFRPSLWRANTINSRSVNNTPDLERGASIKSGYFNKLDRAPTNASNHHSSTTPGAAYQTDLKRDNSIATAISMRRADIMVSRDNPQHLHQHRISGVRNDDEDTTIHADLNDNLDQHSIHAAPCEKDELLYEKKKSIIILLGRLLLKCGCPCHRVDETLQHTSKLLELDASFSFLPDSVLITFTDGDETQSIMVKSPQGFDNGKIAKINDIMNFFQRGELDLDRCLVLLHDVATAPPTCGVWSTVTFFTLSSFTASAMMFGGTWIDACISGALGLLVAILYILSAHFPIYARVFEISASVVVAIITRALHNYCCFTSVVLSAILILLPGYTMTVGVIELSARHVTTGIVRLVYAVFYAFQLAYGLQVGSSVYNAIDPSAPEDGLCGQPLVSPWFYILLLPVLSIAIALSYGSSRKQWISQTLSATIAFCLSYFLGKVIPDGQIVGSIAAFAIGLYSNFALKITGEPPLAPLCVGVTLLVPGSIGVRGAYSVLHQTDLTQGNFPMQMLTIALGLSAGLFAAAMIVYPAGKKRSMYISL